MGDGITVKVLGDFGPFSRMGKSIGYQVIIVSKPPALPGDAQSLTIPGLCFSRPIRVLILTLTDCGQAPSRGQQS
jgi:hypothetical protein